MKKNPYIVTGVELPVRTQTAKKNAERWEEFSQRLEDALNSATKEGHTILSHQIIEGHGAIIISHQKDEEAEQESGKAIALSARSLPEPLRSLLMPPPPGERAAQVLMGEVLASWPEGAHPSEEELATVSKQACERYLSSEPLELRRECLESLTKILSEHEAEDHEDPCPFLTAGKILQKELTSFIELRMN